MSSLLCLLAAVSSEIKRWIYRNNAFGFVTTFNGYKKSGSNVAIEKNADHMKLTFTSAYGWAYSNETINLTDYKKIWFYGYHGITGATIQFDVRTDYTLNESAGNVATIPVGSSGFISIDVSALNGNYYVRFGAILPYNVSGSVYCYQIYLTK